MRVSKHAIQYEFVLIVQAHGEFKAKNVGWFGGFYSALGVESVATCEAATQEIMIIMTVIIGGKPTLSLSFASPVYFIHHMGCLMYGITMFNL